MADYSKDLYDYKYECRRNCSAYDDGYEQGASDMEKAKQIIIDKLQKQISKWHLVADGDLPSEDLEECILVVNGKYKNITYVNAIMPNGGYCKGIFYIDGVIKNGVEVIAWMELPKFEEVD